MSFLGLILVSFSASAMVGGKAVLPSDPLVSQVAQIATWSESRTVSKTFDGDVVSENSKHVVPNCTATFVAENLLITAAHCIAKPNNLKVDLSWENKGNVEFHGLGRVTEASNETNFNIVDSRVPSDGQDVALIKIDRKILGRGLPLLSRKPLVNEKILSYGFGQKQPLNTLIGFSLEAASPTLIQTFSPKFFTNSLSTALSRDTFQSVKPAAETMTLLKKTTPGGHCYGDSGGPNLVAGKNGFSIVGVTVQVLPTKDSWVCVDKSAIVNVSPLEPWLNQAARELGGQIRWVK